MKKAAFILVATTLAASLSACASGGRYASQDRYYGNRDTRCEQDRSNERLAGTVIGAGVGALAGSAVAGNSSNTAGTVAGGVAGAIIGNQIAKGDPCPPDYRR